MARLFLAESGQCLLEEGNRGPRLPAAERDLTQSCEPLARRAGGVPSRNDE